MIAVYVCHAFQMKLAATQHYTHSHTVLSDGTVAFRCSNDVREWPWLALHPRHPTVVQSINFWASVETGTSRGTYDPLKWSALTQTEWSCGPGQFGHATHGVSDITGGEDNRRYRMTLFDDTGALVYHMTGKGVVFRRRNFEGWRGEAKEKLPEPSRSVDFAFASAGRLGVATQDECFLSELAKGKTPAAQGLVSKARGFLPRHPYHGGSGDHVNSNQLADVGTQFLHLARGDAPFIITGGSMSFSHYVELGQAFDIAQNEAASEQGVFSIDIRQADRDCASMTYTYQDK